MGVPSHIDPGPPIIVDTAKVHSVGSDIASDATNDEWNNPGSVFDLDYSLDKITSQLPQIVQPALQVYQRKIYQAYMDVLDVRIKVGEVLNETASQTEINEIKTQGQFNPTLLPTTHSFYTKK